MGFFLLFVWLVVTVCGWWICFSEWVEARRVARFTNDQYSLVRRLVAEMLVREAFLRVALQTGILIVAILAAMNPAPPTVTGRMIVSRLILSAIPLALASKALRQRRDRITIIEATRNTFEFEQEMLTPYLSAVWRTMAILIVDMKTGIIAHASDPVHGMFGYPNGTLIGLSIDQLVPNALRDKHEAQREEYAKDPRTRVMYDHRFAAQRMDGTLFTVGIHLAPVLGNSRVLAVIAEQRS